MKLIESNIRFVKRLEKDGIPYEWAVGMKSGRVSDLRVFVNYRKNDRGAWVTAVEQYEQDRLPKAVQRFIEKRRERVLPDRYQGDADSGFAEYIFE